MAVELTLVVRLQSAAAAESFVDSLAFGTPVSEDFDIIAEEVEEV